MNRILFILFFMLAAAGLRAQTIPMYGDAFVWKNRSGFEMMWLYNTGKLKLSGYQNSDTTYFFTSDAAGNLILKKIYTGTPGAITQEKDSIFLASAAASIDSNDINNWNSVFSASITYANKDSLNNYLLRSKTDSAVNANANVTANTAARHTHANKAALDNVSGTNTGDETKSRIIALFGYTPADSSKYLPFTGGNLTGTVNFAGGIIYTIGNQNFFANGSNMHFIYTGTNGIQFTNQANTIALGSLSNTGSFSVIGTISGSNLSGTNTGDETTARINALYGYTPANGANYLALTGGTMIGAVAFTPQATPSAPASGFKLFAELSAGSFSWINSSGFVRTLRVRNQSQDLILYLQNKASYTVADSSDLAALATIVASKQNSISGSGYIVFNGTSYSFNSKVPLGTDVSGVLSIALGGTNNTSFPTNYLTYHNGTKIDSVNLYWDKTNQRLGIKNAAPAYTLDITGSLGVSGGVTLTGAPTLSLLGYGGTGTPQTIKFYNLNYNGMNAGLEMTDVFGAQTWATTVAADGSYRIFDKSCTSCALMVSPIAGNPITAARYAATMSAVATFYPLYATDNTNNNESGLYKPVTGSVGVIAARIETQRHISTLITNYVPMQFLAGTISNAPIILPTGTLTTTPTNGYIERDAYTLYVTTTNGRQAVAAGTIVTGTGGVNQFFKFYVASTPYYIAINASLPQ